MSASERVKGIQVHRPIIYGSHARLLTEEEKQTAPPGHTHRWTVFFTSATSPPPERLPSGELVKESIDYLPGGADDLSYLIKKVTFKLHDTYASPNRTFDKPPFAVTETGWGEFVVQIRIQFIPESSEKPLTLNHPIKLHHWGPPIEGTVAPPTEGGTATQPSSTAPTPAPTSDAAQPSSSNVAPAPSEDKVKQESVNTPAAGQADTKPDEKKEGEGDSSVVLEPTQVSSTSGNANANANANGQGNEDGKGNEFTEDSQIVVDTQQATQPISIASVLPVHSWQYDELIFSDPPKGFLDILNENPPTPLPNKNRRPKDQREEHEAQNPSSAFSRKNKKLKGRNSMGTSMAGSRANTVDIGTPTPSVTGAGAAVGAGTSVGAGVGIPGELGSADVPLEFSLEMEKGEYNKLGDARRKIVEQMDRWRWAIDLYFCF
uniref:Protein AF-9 homolog n=1 Tax=Kwoniella dejecticola CBS 10117 TaxID=1296121 RepID=A0A1A5ZZ36_9TREE|nr:YEATS domain-containing protein 4 [Kwoniella dejecticola CBS 10117]OBR83050.1 YEATS domain-containing protein 4 [Kwoniella dejecticola CBS 10117]